MSVVVHVAFGSATLQPVLGIETEWAGAIDLWVKWLTAAQRPATTIGLRVYQIQRFALDHPDADPFGLTLDDLIGWLAAFEWKPQTRRSYRSALRVFCAWAHATGRASANPAALLPAVTPPRGKPRPAPDDVLSQAMTVATDRVRLMLRLAAHAGLRRAEIAAVHRDDLELDADGYMLRVVGKGGTVRLVPVLDDLAMAIRMSPTGPMFPGRIDGHLSPRRVGELMSEALPGHWTAHTLRHRFASKAYAAERDILTVSALLGHASVTTTQIYTAIPSGALRNAVIAAA